MARRTEQEVYFAIAGAYASGIEAGLTKVLIHIDWLPEICYYLNVQNNNKEYLETVKPLDDWELDQLMKRITEYCVNEQTPLDASED